MKAEMKYTEYTVYPPAGEVAEVTAMLTSLGQAELEINDPAEVEEFFSKDGGYKWNYADSEMVERLKAGAYVRFYVPEGEALSEDILSYIKGYDYST